MTKTCRTQKLEVRITALCLALAPGALFVTACGGPHESGEAAVGTMTSGDPELIGGHQAGPDHFRSTVAISGDCTAAKVGARLFLTAAHCVSLGRPSRMTQVPDDFPPNGGLREEYLPGQRLLTLWGLHADDPERAELTIAKTSIHPSWWECPRCQDAVRAGAADIAVIEVEEDTPDIPEAQVELGRIPQGTQVVKVGWGCEDRTNRDAETVSLGRYKTADAWVIAASEIRRFDARVTDEDVAMVDAGYLVTGGHDRDATNASLCLGDSGGPLYLADRDARRVVGVNADYTFRPPAEQSDQPELGGVSWTDWHTRTSLDSFHGVGWWLTELRVNTAGDG